MRRRSLYASSETATIPHMRPIPRHIINEYPINQSVTWLIEIIHHAGEDPHHHHHHHHSLPFSSIGTSNPSGLTLEHKELFSGRFLEQDTSRAGINVIATTHNEITGKWLGGADNSISDGSIISFWMPPRAWSLL
ncbi:hypothetical protein CDAR_544991 [Caerostris darwini]|uniref:Uncharacterized protein n=1 Tax=Caerostris darwini TaxID=1538125 RepID=A0AAV4PT97_9ARAC|nr:hypothetical protein CDAR_544991 [Caerostris darwini]